MQNTQHRYRLRPWILLGLIIMVTGCSKYDRDDQGRRILKPGAFVIHDVNYNPYTDALTGKVDNNTDRHWESLRITLRILTQDGDIYRTAIIPIYSVLPHKTHLFRKQAFVPAFTYLMRKFIEIEAESEDGKVYVCYLTGEAQNK